MLLSIATNSIVQINSSLISSADFFVLIVTNNIHSIFFSSREPSTMDEILIEKTHSQRTSVTHRYNSSDRCDSLLPSPRNQYGIGINQLLSRNMLSARGQRSTAGLFSARPSAKNMEQKAYPLVGVNMNIPSHEASDKRDEKSFKPIKIQPRISYTPLLPSVFINEKPSAPKMK